MTTTVTERCLHCRLGCIIAEGDELTCLNCGRTPALTPTTADTDPDHLYEDDAITDAAERIVQRHDIRNFGWSIGDEALGLDTAYGENTLGRFATASPSVGWSSAFGR